MPLSITAIVIAGVGVTPFGEAASSTVRSALFSTDAGTVDKIRVSRTPKARQLLALDRNGRYPRAVIPPTIGAEGPRGAQGGRGAQGPDGRPGGHTFFIRSRTGQTISRFQDERTVVSELEELPAGAWLVLAQLAPGGTGSAAPMSCAITRRNVVLAPMHTSIGRGSGGMRFTSALTLTGWTSDQPATLKLDCGMNAESTREAVTENVWFGAIRVGSLEVRRQGP